MTEASDELVFSQRVEASPDNVFYAFTTAQGWRNWMCDSARFEGRPGGSYQLAWNNGWYASGTVCEVTRPEKVALTWLGMGDPGPTDVTIKLKEKDGKTLVELSHAGFGQKGDWVETRQEALKGWERGLENLESIFRTGEDLREIRRPLLGITVSDFNEQIAQELGVPVTKGIRVDKPIEGMGAERAGMRLNDVIVEMDDVQITGFAAINEARLGRHAGEVVKVVFYRGSEKHEVEMALSSQPFAEVPLNPVELAERVRAIDAEVMTELRALFVGVSEAEAEYCPSTEAWSAKETLAHLIVGEIGGQDYISSLINDNGYEFPENWSNVRARLQALVAVTPTIPELLDRLEKGKEETAILLERADALNARKGVMWGLGQGYLQLPGVHDRTHIEQMRAAIEAARKG
ncbi:MAG TPA: PDZ domain-containing protein [Anaerolineae bacterium]|nr:PDZ domain-containing protein [Anaerolineae bacterium]